MYFILNKCVLNGTSYINYNVGSVEKKKSWLECSVRCHKNPRCFAWSFVTMDFPLPQHHGNCHMKDQNYSRGKKSVTGVLSGATGCGISKCEVLKQIYCYGLKQL